MGDDIVIRARGLGKRYRIGRHDSSYGSLRESLANLASAPARKLAALVRGDRLGQAPEAIWALKDVDLDVRRGEVLGIIGRNGAGKSTLLKILSRITEPTTGRVELAGRVGSLLEVGTGFHPELTGRENIYLNGAILGMHKAEIDRKFDRIIDFSGIAKFLDTPVKRYSSGMYVRLAFSVAAHLEPDVLIIDEVLAVGDVEFQRRCLGKMQELGNSGRTVLFVSHNMPAVKTLCGRALLIDKARIVTSGIPGEVIDRYLNASQAVDNRYRRGHNEGRLPEIFITEAEAGLAASDECVEIQVRYEVACERVGAVLAVRISNAGGSVVATVLDTDSDPDRFEKSSGMYQTTCRFPSDVLVPGTYYVTLSIADMKSTRFEFLEHVLSFSIPFHEGTANVFSGREGILRLAASWPLKKLDERNT